MVTTFTISKEVYFNSISCGFKDNIALIDAVKLDFPRMDVLVNNKRFNSYCDFLENIYRNIAKYVKK